MGLRLRALEDFSIMRCQVFYWVLVLNSGLLYKFCQTIKCRASWRPARAPRGWNEATGRQQERRTQMETEVGGMSATYWHSLVLAQIGGLKSWSWMEITARFTN
ncbi:hypothetical protein H8958_022551, partial [Nasalis larvatus]